MSILSKNASKLHKTYTVILSFILAVVSFAEYGGKDVLHALNSIIPGDVFPFVSGVMGVLIIVGRYINQPSLHHKEDTTVLLEEDKEIETSTVEHTKGDLSPEKEKIP